MIDVSQLWVTEWVVIGFFGYLIVLARLRPLTPRQRGRVVLVGLVCGAVVFMLSQLRLSPILRLTREWLPAIYLIEGYWLCSLFLCSCSKSNLLRLSVGGGRPPSQHP